MKAWLSHVMPTGLDTKSLSSGSLGGDFVFSRHRCFDLIFFRLVSICLSDDFVRFIDGELFVSLMSFEGSSCGEFWGEMLGITSFIAKTTSTKPKIFL